MLRNFLRGLKTGFDSASGTQSAKSNLGTVTDPTGLWSDVNGLRLRAMHRFWEVSVEEAKQDGVG